MLRRRLLGAILRKEITEAAREKHVRVVTVVGMVLPLFFAWIFTKAEIESRDRLPDKADRLAEAILERAAREAGTKLEQLKDTEPRYLGAWPVRFAVGYGAFLASIFAVTLALEAFVGEKERKTLEVLLASPATDRELFAAKVASCVVASVALGVIFSAVASAGTVALARLYGLAMPWGVLGRAIIGTLVLLFALSVTSASVGSVISSKVSTVKGGGQVFGVTMMGMAVVTIALLVLLEPYGARLKPVLSVASHLPGWLVMVVVLCVLGLLDYVLLSIGAATFNREKTLTDI